MDQDYILNVLYSYSTKSEREMEKYEENVLTPIVNHILLDKLSNISKTKIKDKWDVYHYLQKSGLKEWENLWGVYDNLGATLPDEELPESEILQIVRNYLRDKVKKF